MLRALARRLVPREAGSGGPSRPFEVAPDEEGNPRLTYRDEFVEFIAARRGMPLDRAGVLVDRAAATFEGGWGGGDYRRFTEQALETFRPLHDDTPDHELVETYRFHAPADFLRMLAYPIPSPRQVAPIVERLATKKSVRIVDYGCGLAQRSLAVTRHLASRGIESTLWLVDIKRDLHWDFLGFLCRRHQLRHELVEVTTDNPYPGIPEHDYCDVVSVLEHLRDPVRAIRNLEASLAPGGLMLAATDDEPEEMMHISPDLADVRAYLSSAGLRPVGTCCGIPLLQKAHGPSVPAGC